MTESDPIIRILAEIEAEHRALTALMARLTPAQIDARPAGGWSAVETLIHITAWQANALRVARDQAAPDAPPLDPEVGPGRILGLTTDDVNDDLLTTHRHWTLDQALAWHNRVNDELRRALVVLPPRRLLGGSGPHGACRWYGQPAITHSRAHRLELEKRLA